MRGYKCQYRKVSLAVAFRHTAAIWKAIDLINMLQLRTLIPLRFTFLLVNKRFFGRLA
jgi:hypothetical protein